MQNRPLFTLFIWVALLLQSWQYPFMGESPTGELYAGELHVQFGGGRPRRNARPPAPIQDILYILFINTLLLEFEDSETNKS